MSTWAARACPLISRPQEVPEHDDSELNEFVDGEAKRDAAGDVTAVHELPETLRTPLPASISALRQEFDARLKEQCRCREEEYLPSVRRP